MPKAPRVMTRDYKPVARARKAPSSGSEARSWSGYSLGCAWPGNRTGCGRLPEQGTGPVCLARKPADPVPPAKTDSPRTSPSNKPEAPAPKPEEKPRFDFYSILPVPMIRVKPKRPRIHHHRRLAEIKETFYFRRRISGCGRRGQHESAAGIARGRSNDSDQRGGRTRAVTSCPGRALQPRRGRESGSRDPETKRNRDHSHQGA